MHISIPKLHLPKTKKPLFLSFFLALVLLLGIGIGYASNHIFSENPRFEAYAEEIFKSEVASNTLNLHYSLANPQKLGIQKKPAGLGTVQTDMKKTYALCEEYERTLKEFSYDRLSRENRLTLDMLLLYFHTRRSLGDNYLLEEMLSPSLGIQAQLPVLLAEYAFYRDEDITDYLNLLGSVPAYFESILTFQKEKSEAGFFMSDTTLNRILRQCQAFIQNPEDNYILEVFAQKLSDYGAFSKKEQKKLCAAHKKLVLNHVIPAYQTLMSGLKTLQGTGKSSRGLAHFKGGKQYYRYLLESEVGTYLPVHRIEKRLLAQLETDSREISLMLREQASLLDKVHGGVDLPQIHPEQTLEFLQKSISKDFPALEDVSYEIRYVHESMEDFLSPAFYLTPPLDTGDPNVIYLNRASQSSNLELFTTLAHEGFPGHLYQTVSFGRTSPAYIRYLLNSSGYAEGWATYIESYAYDYAASLLQDEAAADVTRMAWLNRSVNLCVYSLLDIGIHYRGWNVGETEKFLSSFGIRDIAAVQEIFQYIVETPANYLKYYWGYLNFLDLKKAEQARLGEDFSQKRFHECILEIGPVAFPILEKYIPQYHSGKI